MRGKLTSLRAESTALRITPAGAGKTLPRPTSSATFWDHPRRCGENLKVYQNTATTAGSPPQVRGKLDDIPAKQRERRITPAGAGKTALWISRSSRRKDHPRRCGENAVRTANLRHRRGSPPQVRGKLCRCLGTNPCKGITPAGAGKTYDNTVKTEPREDHPRRCGENLLYLNYENLQVGSPPQVRGKRTEMTFVLFLLGITPAGAGKTVPVFGHRAHNRDHPRRCGENSV